MADPAANSMTGVRRSRKPSAQSAISGPVTVRAIMGADRIRPICAPLRPSARNQAGMKGVLIPITVKMVA